MLFCSSSYQTCLILNNGCDWSDTVHVRARAEKTLQIGLVLWLVFYVFGAQIFTYSCLLHSVVLLFDQEIQALAYAVYDLSHTDILGPI